MDVDALARADRARGPPALLYVIPNFQNPSGVTMPLERRGGCRAGQGARLRIVEDDPYGLLRWARERVPSLFELDGGE